MLTHLTGCNFFVWSFHDGNQIHENENNVRVHGVQNRNYDSFKNKRNDPDRIELKKYCPTCKKHTVHKESK